MVGKVGELGLRQENWGGNLWRGCGNNAGQRWRQLNGGSGGPRSTAAAAATAAAVTILRDRGKGRRRRRRRRR